MNITLITKEHINHRKYWISEISRLGGNFGIDAQRVAQEIDEEIINHGKILLVNHLRLCGAIPERYGHDTTEEKLYSKYTDVIIHQAFKAIGLTSLVLQERANVADVECVCNDYSFVADAKAFRLSRTAKNQKDFKIQAMDNWKHGKPYAMVVCPVYQLPTRASQIYLQAVTRSVLILTYTHLAVLVRYSEMVHQTSVCALLHRVFETVRVMNPSNDALYYWQAVNRIITTQDETLAGIWQEEKLASLESIAISQREALEFLASERSRIMQLSHEQAINEVLKWRKVDNRIRAVESVTDNGLLEIG